MLPRNHRRSRLVELIRALSIPAPAGQKRYAEGSCTNREKNNRPPKGGLVVLCKISPPDIWIFWLFSVGTFSATIRRALAGGKGRHAPNERKDKAGGSYLRQKLRHSASLFREVITSGPGGHAVIELSRLDAGEANRRGCGYREARPALPARPNPLVKMFPSIRTFPGLLEPGLCRGFQ